MNLLVLDNYDSFTYNLVHIIRELGVNYEVHRNNKILLKDISRFDSILLSPGPGIPDEAGIMKDVIRTYGSVKNILGVCLGHQAIAEVYGAELVNMKDVLHGVTSNIRVKDKSRLFKGLPDTFRVTHYHSWAVKRETINENIKVTSDNAEGLVMSISHKEHDVHGVQFHPESIMTEHGKQLIKNWLNIN